MTVPPRESITVPAGASESPAQNSRHTSAARLAAVDGLRAAAALWVVLFHVRVFSGAHLPFAPLDFFARSGSTGVSLFLVISGFCLYLPFAAGRQSRFRTGSFFLRRIRRLMPAYYCSIAFALALNLVGGGALGFGPMSVGAVVQQVVTHVTMTHTLFASTFYALNGAYWSLGLEWQLYLALPILIVGAKRIGLAPTLAAAVLVNAAYRLALASATSAGLVQPGVVAAVVLPNLLPGRWAEFVFGMVVAELYARGRLERLPSVAAFAWVPMMGVAVFADKLSVSHLFYGAAFALLLVAALGPGSAVGRIFSWRPLVALGIMSYSLYLVHQPVVQALAYVLRHDAALSTTWTFVALVALLPVILLIAWLLFVAVERRTLTSRPVEITGWLSAILFPRLPWAARARGVALEQPAA